MSEAVTRRALVCGGCALVATGCGPDWDTPAPLTGRVPVNSGDSGPPSPPEPTSEPMYPCGQSAPTSASRTGFALADYPDLSEVGGWISVSAGGREILIAHVEEGCYTAILRACSHEGVAINYRPDRFQFVCPRHGAIYDPDGSKVAGPQPTGLPVFPAARDGNTVWVDVT